MLLQWGDTGQREHARWLAALAVGVPAAAAWAIEWALGRANPVLAWLWTVAVLYVCLGFRQFSTGFAAVRAALAADDIDEARKAYEAWTGKPAGTMTSDELAQAAATYGIAQTHRQVLAPLLAFLLLPGVGGPVLYRVAELCASPRAGASPAFTAACGGLFRWLELASSRISAAGFAVVGHFEEAAMAWRNWNITAAGEPLLWLLAVAYAAIGVRSETRAEREHFLGLAALEFRTPQLANVVGLLWRSVVLWMALFALVQFTAFVT
jgi:adenosylcobinamide-phosphate synthase